MGGSSHHFADGIGEAARTDGNKGRSQYIAKTGAKSGFNPQNVVKWTYKTEYWQFSKFGGMNVANIQELQEQYSSLEAQKASLFEQGSVDQVQVSRLNEQMQVVKLQITAAEQEQQIAQQVQQEQEQVKEEVLSTLAQEIADLDVFGALFPGESYQSILGLETINEKRKALNEILYTITAQTKTQVIEMYDPKLAERDAQIRSLSVDKAALEVRVNELMEQYEDAVVTVMENDTEIAKLKAELETATVANAYLDKTTSAAIAQLTADNESLKDQLARKQEVAAPKPNQSIADLLQATRNNSIKSAKDIAISGESFRGKVILGPTGEALTPPTIGGSESQDSFRSEDNQANAADDTVPATEVVALEPPTLPLGLDVAEGDVNGEVPAKTVEERLKALEIAVFGTAEVAA